MALSAERIRVTLPVWSRQTEHDQPQANCPQGCRVEVRTGVLHSFVEMSTNPETGDQRMWRPESDEPEWL